MSQELLQNLAAITEQVKLAENRAAQLTAKLHELEQANDAATLRMSELAKERIALADLVTQLEKEANKIVTAQPELMVDALKRWLKDDGREVAEALHDFLVKAVR